MFRSIACLGFALIANAAWACAAHAADQPIYGPPASWVKPVALATPSSPDTTTPTRILFENVQVKFGTDMRESYFESMAKIQTPQGLAAVGNLALNWRPDTDTLTIHKLRILRGDQTIDLLAGGRTFTVLRRENNLEMAMLDGALTAAIQPEGLQVGDILNMAFTVRNSDPVTQSHAEWLTGNMLASPIERLSIHETWPKSRTLRWRQTEGLAPAKITTTQDGGELAIEMTHTEPPKAPKGAPARYFQLGELEGTEFRSWAEVSALIAPLFEKASTLGPNSPLKAEAAKIKAASGDPKIQAMAALKLVEDQIRYLFLGMNNGGYVPADADVTWSRRFGDCKGKTTMLIALLHELGIDAEPAMASTTRGDGLDERLPTLEIFDHVLVRAVIAGKVYWLDGTRSADRDLDQLPIPRFHWLLPVQKSGGALVKLIVPQPEKPLNAVDLQIDASAGLDVPAPVHATAIFRGDEAIVLNLQSKAQSPANIDKNLRAYWKNSYDWIDITKVDAVYDAAAGEERLTMEGTGKMDWRDYSQINGREYEVDGSQLGWKADYDREAGSKQDAPFAVVYPFFSESTETIQLPNVGAPFIVSGADVDKVAAGMRFRRSSKVEDHVFTMRASAVALVPEFAAAAAPAAKKDLRDLWDVTVYLQTPVVYVPTNQDIKARLGEKLATAEDYARRGYDLQIKGQYDNAIADYTRAIELKPETQYYRLRAQLLLSRYKAADALADADHGVALTPQDADMHALRARALTLLDRKTEVEQEMLLAIPSPPTADAYMRRAMIRDPSDIDGKLADLDEALKLAPASAEALNVKFNLYALRGDVKAALDVLDRAIAVSPDNIDLLRAAVFVHTLEKQYEPAIADMDRIVAKKPDNIEYLSERCRIKALAGKDFSGALADCEAALKLDPTLDETKEARGFVYLRFGHFDAAIADYSDVLKTRPNSPTALFGMGLAEFKSGVTGNGQADLAKARANNPHIDAEFTATESLSAPGGLAADTFTIVAQPMTADLYIQRGNMWAARRAYDPAAVSYSLAIQLAPNFAQAYANRGMAYLNMGSVDQANGDFTKALQLDAKQMTALEGKGGVAYRRGDSAAAIAAFTHALEIKPDSVDVLFERSRLFAKQHQYDLALKDMDALVAAAPNNASALNSRCWFRAISGGDANQALADCDTSLKIESSAAAFDSRGLVYLRLGRFDEALADYDAACKGRPNQAGSIFGRGLAKLRKGASADGQADLAAARAIDPQIDAEYADYGLKP